MPKEASASVSIKHVEIEITSRCNMHCQHCRYEYAYERDMSVSELEKTLNFIESMNRSSSDRDKDYMIALQGGEPFFHPDLFKILKLAKEHEKNGCYKVIFNTNGSLLEEKQFNFFKKIRLKNLVIIFSLDSFIQADHDKFRNFPGSFKRTLDAIRKLKATEIPNLKLYIKTSVRKNFLDKMEKMLLFSKKLDCDGFHMTDIQPLGRALENPGLRMEKKEKIKFLENAKGLIRKYDCEDFRVVIFDSLMNLVLDKSEIERYSSSLGCLHCGAGTNYFSVKANGDVCPCELMPLKITNIFRGSTKDNIRSYLDSPIIKNLYQKKFSGKCGQCEKEPCMGCRARAWSLENDYLASDPDCWI